MCMASIERSEYVHSFPAVMGGRRIFPGMGKLGGLETKVPSGVQWWNSGWVWGEAPKADEKLRKMHT